MMHSVKVSALSNNAHILVHRQNLGCACPENRLRIGQYDLVHVCLTASIAKANLKPVSPALSGCAGNCGTDSGNGFFSLHPIGRFPQNPSTASICNKKNRAYSFGDRCRDKPWLPLVIFLARDYSLLMPLVTKNLGARMGKCLPKRFVDWVIAQRDLFSSSSSHRSLSPFLNKFKGFSPQRTIMKLVLAMPM
jgi:hypothetical protein